MNPYHRLKKVEAFPRIPLEGYIDFTYRCNNDCLHCWLRIGPDSDRGSAELSLDEIGRIGDEARALGCRKWTISGGEPMLRPDFPEIFERLTSKTSDYILNTNGTLVTPRIARLLKRKGAVLVALYGADAQVHDAVTRRPGSFEETMRGIAYLKEEGVHFIAQIVPMRANVHQFEDMKRLALTLGPRWRVGATWLYLSADGNPVKNREIEAQRLTPREVFEVERPDFLMDEEPAEVGLCKNGTRADDFFGDCIRAKRDFYIDPYGRMTFCGLIKASALLYDLRRGSVREAWEEFIPALAGTIGGGEEFSAKCGLCDLGADCGWCPAYAYLEHRRFPGKIEYLCRLTEEKRRIKKDWIENHRRFYRTAEITIQVDSDLPLEDNTFLPYLRSFEVEGPGKDIICLRHHFNLPPFEKAELGTLVYQAGAWTIFKKGGSWIYFEGAEGGDLARAGKIAVLSDDHTRAKIYHENDRVFRQGSLSSLSSLPTDQILLSRILADRQGCLLHACGVTHEGKGLLFVGHSEAGKSTVGKMYAERGLILCDDRIILRRWPDGYRIYGTWHPGELRDVSPDSAPLAGLFFLEKADTIQIDRMSGKAEIVRRLAACIIRPLATVDWWHKALDLLERIADEVPCYGLRFDRSGRIVDRLKDL